MTYSEKIIELQNLKKYYPVTGGVMRRTRADVKALDGIDLDIFRGDCLGVVGESGCGKTTASKAIIRLHDLTDGRILYYPEGDKDNASLDISKMKRCRMKKLGIRGKMQMVFQDPTTSLNPRMLIKNIIAEPIKEHNHLSSRDQVDRVTELLRLVGLSKNHLLRYPHEFSGGQRQRVAVARAIATNPEFIVLDEPTSALDVSVQAQILNLLMKLRQKFKLTYLFVTHHLLVVKYVSNRIIVMYLGKIVEVATTKDLFSHPAHPYTFALLSGIPNPSMKKKGRRIVLSGDVPSPLNPPKGCRFHNRCPFAQERCQVEEPPLETVETGHMAACHRKGESARLVKDRFGSTLP